MGQITGTTNMESALRRFRNYLIEQIKNVEENIENGKYKTAYLDSLKETKKQLDEVLKWLTFQFGFLWLLSHFLHYLFYALL